MATIDRGGALPMRGCPSSGGPVYAFSQSHVDAHGWDSPTLGSCRSGSAGREVRRIVAIPSSPCMPRSLVASRLADLVSTVSSWIVSDSIPDLGSMIDSRYYATCGSCERASAPVPGRQGRTSSSRRHSSREDAAEREVDARAGDRGILWERVAPEGLRRAGHDE